MRHNLELFECTCLFRGTAGALERIGFGRAGIRYLQERGPVPPLCSSYVMSHRSILWRRRHDKNTKDEQKKERKRGRGRAEGGIVASRKYEDVGETNGASKRRDYNSNVVRLQIAL